MGNDVTEMRPQNGCDVTSSGTDGNKNHQFKTQSTKWIMTWNNYPENGLCLISNKLAPLCSKWVFGLEVGKQGTEHIQGGFIFDTKKRMSSIFRLFGWKPGDNNVPFYITPMRGDWYSQKYCIKDGTCISNDKYFLERKRVMRQQLTSLYGWQQHVVNRIELPPDARTILYVNMKYASGKTSLCHYLNEKYGAVIIDGEKRHLLAQVENNKKSDIFIYNQPADGGSIPWDAMEMIKDGLFASHFGTKNNGMCRIEHYVHLIIFSNKKLDDNIWGYNIDKKRFKIIDK